MATNQTNDGLRLQSKNSYGYRGPATDHTLLSPSGHVSKRARAAALKRDAARLFPPGYWDEPAKSDSEQACDKAASLRRSAVNLRALAAKGMSPRKFVRAAERMEAAASALAAA